MFVSDDPEILGKRCGDRFDSVGYLLVFEDRVPICVPVHAADDSGDERFVIEYRWEVEC